MEYSYGIILLSVFPLRTYRNINYFGKQNIPYIGSFSLGVLIYPRILKLVSYLVVEPVHQGSSPQLGIDARSFLDLFQDLNDAILSVVGGMLVDSDALMVTSSISKICWLINLSNVLIER
jgi:hypothetical protein